MTDAAGDASVPAPTSPRTIQPDEDIYRRIIPDWVVKDERAPGGNRLSSAAFLPFRDSPPSGYVAAECTHQDVLGPACPTCSVGAIKVRALQDNRYTVERNVIQGEHRSH